MTQTNYLLLCSRLVKWASHATTMLLFYFIFIFFLDSLAGVGCHIVLLSVFRCYAHTSAIMSVDDHINAVRTKRVNTLFFLHRLDNTQQKRKYPLYEIK